RLGKRPARRRAIRDERVAGSATKASARRPTCHGRVPFTAKDAHAANDDHYSHWLQSRNSLCSRPNDYHYKPERHKGAADVCRSCVWQNGPHDWHYHGIPRGPNSRNIWRTEPIRIAVTRLQFPVSAPKAVLLLPFRK